MWWLILTINDIKIFWKIIYHRHLRTGLRWETLADTRPSRILQNFFACELKSWFTVNRHYYHTVHFTYIEFCLQQKHSKIYMDLRTKHYTETPLKLFMIRAFNTIWHILCNEKLTSQTQDHLNRNGLFWSLHPIKIILKVND